MYGRTVSRRSNYLSVQGSSTIQNSTPASPTPSTIAPSTSNANTSNLSEFDPSRRPVNETNGVLEHSSPLDTPLNNSTVTNSVLSQRINMLETQVYNFLTVINKNYIELESRINNRISKIENDIQLLLTRYSYPEQSVLKPVNTVEPAKENYNSSVRPVYPTTVIPTYPNIQPFFAIQPPITSTTSIPTIPITTTTAPSTIPISTMPVSAPITFQPSSIPPISPPIIPRKN